ncbi:MULTISPECIES: ABC transporter ATP-binding protein [Streptomyces]|uniref:ABC transporter ATP-binding protein n=1 Tax=unclassified Streptomyces TaxID=2593676 RepID=UPI000882C931|nr:MULTISPECIES: ABC transporter ATP-binding protein [unclassified Streptomyces]MDX2728356.1 ABC transporter ATP-binding protein [Streptomyces sp. PA03-2a]MDX3769308.1 ABC transporter ATP-binding protein [Streptomyces sp. AK08-01B]MDX3818372.1 ABC transporter ATP-binding protein [Streptomyces sp. AK08-01A]SCZ07330.1 2-aminoethylphosphonate transport system ATP-binding protein [Streptomyces sp. 136MFCol5.1]SFT19089.1 2-aminoethylphosphonate transport system ATP-binding protein [Streptomyces sp.
MTGTSAPAAVGRTTQAGGIRFDAVSVVYGKNTVLDRFDLTVEPGEVMALLGPSGSGKTTALRAVAGFVRPASGRVWLGDRDVTGLPPHKRGIGMVVQQYALFPHMRVQDNVAFGLKARKVAKAEIPARVAEALELVGMAAYAKRYPRELSGGQQQRVAIARALAVRPGVLLLDEPLSALDARLRSGMLAELARLHRELPDVSILYVTHDQVEALTLADRIAVMDKARLQDCGTPQELYRRPRTEFTASFVGNANLLPVTVAGTAGTVEFAGRRLDVPTGEAAGGVTATLCVRPHLVGLGDGPNALTGALAEVQWRGSTHRLYVDVDGHRIKADLRELRDTPALGDRVTLHFAAEDAVLLPAGATGVNDG